MEKDKLVILVIVGVLGYFLVSGATGTGNPFKWTAPSYRISFYIDYPAHWRPTVKDLSAKQGKGEVIPELEGHTFWNPLDWEGTVEVRVTKPDDTIETIWQSGFALNPGTSTGDIKPTFRPGQKGQYKIKVVLLSDGTEVDSDSTFIRVGG